MDEWIEEIQMLLGYYSKGEYSTTLREGKRLLGEAPSSLSTLLYIALADCVLQLDDTEQALEYMLKARENFDDESMFIDEATLVTKESSPYFFRGELAKSREILESYDVEDSYFIRSHLAQCSFWLGKFDTALEEYQAAYSLCADNENLQEEAQHCRLGEARCHIELGDLETAEKLLVEIYSKEPLDDDSNDIVILAAGRLACVKAWSEKVPEARLLFHSTLAPESFQHPYKKSFCFLHRGIVRFIAGSLEGAREDMEQVINAPIRKYDKLEAYKYLCEIEAVEQNEEDAVRWYREMSSMPEVFLTGQAQALVEQMKQALLQEKAIEVDIDTVSAEKKAALEIMEIDEESEREIWREIPVSAILVGVETVELQSKNS